MSEKKKAALAKVKKLAALSIAAGGGDDIYERTFGHIILMLTEAGHGDGAALKIAAELLDPHGD